MDTKRFYVDFHVLQTVPPSCVNRDDTGSPKMAVYGGAVRARVSSQAWKHAMREMFREELRAEDVGRRTKKIVGLVAEQIKALDPEQKEPEKLASKALAAAGLKIKDEQKGTDAMFFLSAAQAKALAKLAVDGCGDKKAYKTALQKTPSVDMALFGRMVADDASLNVDAAAQVANSISTHAVQNEYDYFTAVDDCAPEDNAGAGHIGTAEFNSATLYRYATVNVCELAESLGAEQAADAVCAFADAFVRSMPTGKQNTFANRTLPDSVYITLRGDQPANLCGAFEKPIPAGPQGYVARSEAALADYAQKVYRDYVDAPLQAFVIGDGLASLAAPASRKVVLEQLHTAVAAHLSGNEGE